MSGPQGQIRRLTGVPAAYIWSAGIRARSPDLHFRTYATRCLRRDMYRQLVFDSRMCSTLLPTVFMLLGCTPLLQYWVTGFQYFATGLPTVLGYWARWARVASVRSLTPYPPGICLVRWGACVSLRLYTQCGVSGCPPQVLRYAISTEMCSQWFLDSIVSANRQAFSIELLGDLRERC